MPDLEDFIGEKILKYQKLCNFLIKIKIETICTICFRFVYFKGQLGVP